MRHLEVVVGAQYGSEAKGHVTAHLANEAVHKDREVAVVRVAGPNAGHTAYDETGQRHAFRQIPCAAVIPGEMTLVIANGSEVDPVVLLQEFDDAEDGGLLEGKKVWVAGEATIVTKEHQQAEQGGSGVDLVKHIGSTGKGVGAARAMRAMRATDRVIDSPWLLEMLHDRKIEVMPPTMAAEIEAMEHIIVEGAQGYGLGLHQGNYPQCTSSDCRAIDFLSMAGINPWHGQPRLRVWAVARVFPIRVAGNSGPLKDETTWAELGLPEEYTTVTQKVRRVGRPDWDLVAEAVEANGGSPVVRLALTMVDQVWPELRDVDVFEMKNSQRERLNGWLLQIEGRVGTRIRLVGTGPETMSEVTL